MLQYPWILLLELKAFGHLSKMRFTGGLLQLSLMIRGVDIFFPWSNLSGTSGNHQGVADEDKNW